MNAFVQQHQSTVVITVVMAFGIVACGEGPTHGDPIQVNPERAETLGSALGAVMADAFTLDLAINDEGGLSFEETRNCPVSGTLHMTGSRSNTSTISDDTETVTANVQAELTANQCAGRTDDDRVMTFSTPSPFEISSSGEAVVANPDSPDEQLVSADFTVAWTGTFAWDLEGGSSGECDVDMQMTLVVEPGSFGEVSLSGTACGHPVASASS